MVIYRSRFLFISKGKQAFVSSSNQTEVGVIFFNVFNPVKDIKLQGVTKNEKTERTIE